MRPLLLCALAGSALVLAASAEPAFAQAGVSYEPPPVDYADPADAGPSAPLPGVVAEEAPPPPAAAAGPRLRVDIDPYVEVQQAVTAQLAGDGLGEAVLTYTTVAAGVDGQMVTRRVAASFGYRYERRIGINGDVPDEDVHSGIAQVHAQVIPGAVSFDAGGLATRTGGTGRAVGVDDLDSGAQFYSAYAGPTLSTRVGPVAVKAAYRLGYVNVDDDSLAGGASPEGDFDSTIHLATASVGMAPGDALPFGWTASAGYVREDAGALDNRYEGRFVRGDVLVPLSPTFAVTAGVGYSRVEASQSDVRRDAAGVPVLDAAGRFIADPSRPRLRSLDTDGLYYDAGILWRPNPRTEVQLRAGRDDDGDTLIVGAAALQLGRRSGLTVSVFDQDTTMGQGIINNLRALPTEFNIDTDPRTGSLRGGCVFGSEPGAGRCLASSLQAISNVAFRARGASAVFTSTGRLWSIGAGLSYTRRDFHLPDDPLFAAALTNESEDLIGFVSVGRRLTRDVTLTISPYFNFYDSSSASGLELGLAGNGFSTGTSFGFTRSFLMERLRLIVSLGLGYSSILDEDSLVADGLIGLRYTF